jgi:hypothetical protein
MNTFTSVKSLSDELLNDVAVKLPEIKPVEEESHCSENLVIEG